MAHRTRPSAVAPSVVSPRSASRPPVTWALVCVLDLALFGGCSTDPEVLVGRNLDHDVARGGAAPVFPYPDSSTLPVDALGGHPMIDATVVPGSDGAAAIEAAAGSDTGDASEGGGFCSGGPIELPVVGGCSSDIAKRAFKFALCSCSDLRYSGVLTTDAFNSDTPSATTAGGSVGVDGPYVASSQNSSLEGSLWVQGTASIGGQDVHGDLHVGGDLDGQGDVWVGGDVYLTGDVVGSDLSIDGRLIASPDSRLAGLEGTGGVLRRTVAIDAPCDCSKPLDVAAIVAYYGAHHDDAMLGITPDELSSLSDPRVLSLSCGRFFFRGVDARSNDLTLRIGGRTVLAVDGAIRSRGTLRIALAQGAELDLFVTGDIDLEGPIDFGDPEHPAALRVYGGAAFIHSGEAKLAGNLYIPFSRFAASTRMELWGSLFAGGFELSGALTAHYDQAVLDVSGCTPAGRACETCGDCANPTPACVVGRCDVCTTDEQCCAPLRCQSGRCVADVLIK